MIHRETTTDSLVKVIQVLQLGRKTGTLTVERGAGSTFEEGTLVLVNGQVTEAQTERHTSLEAFTYLKTWGQCKFAFIPQNTEKFTPLPLHSITDTEPSLTAQEQFLQRFTQPLSSTQSLPVSQPLSQQRVQQSTSPFLSIIPAHIRPVDEGLRLIAEAQLSRTHKHVFLLIDGHRAAAELAQLTRLEPDKLSTVLDDLAAIRVIRR